MYIAVDVGGTKTLVANFDNNREIMKQIKFPTPQNYDEFKVALLDAISGVLETDTASSIAVALPGVVDRQNGVCLQLGNLPWKNIPIVSDIKSVYNVPISIENDANLAGLSEANEVIDKYNKTLYITISTGIGSVFVVGGTIDPNTADAEIGHMIYPVDDTYKDWEDFASGRWIVEKYGKRASEISDYKTWKEITIPISMGIINASAAYTPDVIVLGGGVGAHIDSFIKPLRDNIAEIKPDIITVPPIIGAKRPEEAVIYGCYELAKQNA